jgi:polyphosphate glucokinase
VTVANDAPASSQGDARGFGIDIGGSGMKAAVVDLETGELASERLRIPTPKPATPEAMADVAAELVHRHEWTGAIGVGFPGIVRHGVVHSAANIDASWVGVDADRLFTSACGVDVAMVNDADAAGLAEVRWGAARGVGGVVLVLTFGTGIGSGLFVDGTLVPNTELGHVELDGRDAESHAAASVRERDGIGWAQWAPRVERYLRHVEMLFSPDLFVVGGGASKVADAWLPKVSIDTPIVAASMANNAGIVGAALVAREGV